MRGASDAEAASVIRDDGLDLQHHALPAAVRRVVGHAMSAGRMVAHVAHVDLDETTRDRLADQARGERRRKEVRKQREDLEAHRHRVNRVDP